jgi:hypothetical protein
MPDDSQLKKIGGEFLAIFGGRKCAPGFME